jgi:S1-C subfamily serine protease
MDPDQPTAVIVHLSGPSRGRSHRLRQARIRIGTTADADVGISYKFTDDRPTPRDAIVLERRGNTYQMTAMPGVKVWVNGELLEKMVLASGDVIEVGRGGPVLRFRLYRAGSRAYKTMSEVFSDCVDCARYGADTPVQRARVLLLGTARELATQLSPLLRAALALAVVIVLFGVGSLWLRQFRLERSVSTSFEAVSDLIERTDRDSFSAEDFEAVRSELDARVSDTQSRVAVLEDRAEARERIIASAIQSIVLLQASYRFVDEQTGRALRLADGGGTGSSFDSHFTLEGEGEVVEIFYTGTAFVVTDDGRLITNRHVALPWLYDDAALVITEGGLRPVMSRFIGYLPGRAEPFDVELIDASESADVALLRCGPTVEGVAPLELADVTPGIGDEVIVLGYPTGMRALVARAEPTFVEQLEAQGALDFWELAQMLASAGHIEPLATVGVVGQTTGSSVVYDAETTHGGSGGPVLELEGRVVAINAAILPEFAGSNLGVPSREALRLLERNESEPADPSAAGD